MRSSLLLFGLLTMLVVSLVAPIASTATAARNELPTGLIDLAHGEGANGVCGIMKIMHDFYWYLLVKSEDDINNLPDCAKKLAYKILVGDFATVSKELATVDIIIIGQPTEPFSDEEKDAIASWLNTTYQKALWCATDSDYPAQGGNQELAMYNCNDLLDYLGQKYGIKLRSDYVSIEDPKLCAVKPYRVIAIVKPDHKYDADLVALGAKYVLMHGPGAVAWVDENGNWHKVGDSGTPDNIVKILVTSPNGRVVEHQPKSPGAPGELGKAHHVGETGSFVLMAAEIAKIGGENAQPKVIIVSGESPYYGYQPLMTPTYYGKKLDGPRFLRNLILWATGVYNELAVYKQLEEEMMNATGKIKADVMKDVENTINQLKSDVTAKLGKVDELADTVSSLSDKVNKLDQRVTALEQAPKIPPGLDTAAYGGIALAIIAIIIALGAVYLAKKK